MQRNILLTRGFREEVSGSDLEKEMDPFVLEDLEGLGATGQADFSDPDVVIAIETAGSVAGTAFLTRELLDLYPFIKIE